MHYSISVLGEPQSTILSWYKTGNSLNGLMNQILTKPSLICMRETKKSSHFWAGVGRWGQGGPEWQKYIKVRFSKEEKKLLVSPRHTFEEAVYIWRKRKKIKHVCYRKTTLTCKLSRCLCTTKNFLN